MVELGYPEKEWCDGHRAKSTESEYCWGLWDINSQKGNSS